MARIFEEIYAVGDSLSDSGGIFQLTSQALTLAGAAGEGLQPIPVSPPYAQRFSNGPVLPEITADLLGATLFNFSFGGAEALGTLTLAEAAGPLAAQIAGLPPDPTLEAILNKNINLSGQVADLVAETSANPPSAHSALVSMIGLNDFQSLINTSSDPQVLIGEAAQVAFGIVQADLNLAHTAYNQGIGTVIFETLPAPSFFPVGSALSPELQAIGDAAVGVVNLGLKADAVLLRLQGHDARVVDLARMADEIQADPSTFGFQNFDQPALVPLPGTSPTEVPFGQFALNPAAPPPDQTAFIDPLHATTNLHGELAAFAVASLTDRTDFRGVGNDFILGRSGDDLVLAGAGNDQASLGGGNDIMFGGLGDDVADGGAGSDLISGGAGNDRLSGGPGSDVLAGNAGNDTLDGGAGDDALIDGLGSDMLFGGPGNDLFFAIQPKLLGGSNTDIDHFDGGSGFDTLAVQLDPTALATEQANVATNFVPGQSFAFSSMNLTATGIEQILLTTQFGFADVPRPGGDLGDRLHQADLFGLV